MSHGDVGAVLREARQRKGYDLETAARRLRIRPDILRALEEGDYDCLPQRGYSRNMVGAYARLVGVSPTQATDAFLESLREYQSASMNPDGRGVDSVVSHRSRRSRSSASTDYSDGYEGSRRRDYSDGYEGSRRRTYSDGYDGSRGRDSLDEFEGSRRRDSSRPSDTRLQGNYTRFSRYGSQEPDRVDMGNGRYRVSKEDPYRPDPEDSYRRRRGSSAYDMDEDDSYSARGERGRSASRAGRRSRQEREEEQNPRQGRRYDDGYSGKGLDSSNIGGIPAFDAYGSARRSTYSSTGVEYGYLGERNTKQAGSVNFTPFAAVGNIVRSRTPMAIAVILIIILLIVVVSLTLCGRSGKEESATTTVPITGMTDTTKNSSDTTTSTTTLVAPTKATFSYEVASDSEAYIEIYVDDAVQLAETVSGPATKSYDVTGTLEFVTSNPDAVTIKVDGSAVNLEESSSGSGVYTYTVDFPSILAAWNKEHGKTTSDSTSTSTSTTTTTTTTTGTSGTSSSTTSSSN